MPDDPTLSALSDRLFTASPCAVCGNPTTDADRTRVERPIPDHVSGPMQLTGGTLRLVGDRDGDRVRFTGCTLSADVHAGTCEDRYRAGGPLADARLRRRREPQPIDIGGGAQVWPGRDGTFQASDRGGWLPGIYADEAAARRAVQVAATAYRALADLVSADVRGIGDEYRPVTVDELAALQPHARPQAGE